MANLLETMVYLQGEPIGHFRSNIGRKWFILLEILLYLIRNLISAFSPSKHLIFRRILWDFVITSGSSHPFGQLRLKNLFKYLVLGHMRTRWVDSDLTKLCAWITLNCPLLQDSLEFESHDLLWIPSGKPSDLELANYEIFRTLLDILGYVVSVSFAEIFDQKFVLRPNSLHTLITFEKSTSLNKFWSKSLFSLSYDDLTIVFIVTKAFR